MTEKNGGGQLDRSKWRLPRLHPQVVVWWCGVVLGCVVAGTALMPSVDDPVVRADGPLPSDDSSAPAAYKAPPSNWRIIYLGSVPVYISSFAAPPVVAYKGPSTPLPATATATATVSPTATRTPFPTPISTPSGYNAPR